MYRFIPVKKLLTDIRFWIFFALIIRLYGITSPPIEAAHNWRQTTVTMPARNFYEVDNNILYPRLDIAGDKTGITGMEFPIFNYLIYLVSLVFGYSHWYGRLISLIFSSMGLYYFYLLVKKYFTPQLAFSSTIVLTFSVWFAFSRKIMPDTFAMSLIMAGMYYGTNYLDRKDSLGNLALFLVLTTTGLLSKVSTVYAMVFFLPLILSRKIEFKRKMFFSLASLVVISPVALWYFYWVPHLVEKFEFWHFYMGKDIGAGLEELIQKLPKTLARFYDSAIKYVGFAFMLFGIVLAIRKRDKTLLAILSLGFASFLYIVLKAGSNFADHEYYIIPLVPLMALVCAYGISQIKSSKWVAIVLLAIAIEGLVNQYHDFTRKGRVELLGLEQDLDKFSSKDDLILINCDGHPTPMYFAHRKGWVPFGPQLQQPNYVDDLKQRGLKYAVILKGGLGNGVGVNQPIVFENNDYSIHKMD